MTGLLAWVFGGLWGGSVIGLVEAAFVLSTSASPEEFGIWTFAFVSYGVFGFAASILALPAPWFLRVGTSASVGFWFGAVPAAFWIARYYVARHFFAEQLPLFTLSGLTVHALLGAGVVVFGMALAILFGWLVGTGAPRRLAELGVAWGLVGAGITVAVHFATPVAPSPERIATAGRPHPNLVLMIIDTLRADALGVYSQNGELSPHLDEFARDGTVFTQAYAQSSWTRPSVATILTGLYPSEHGAARKLDPLPERVETLAEFLHARGYWTAGFVTNINVAPIFNFEQGFGEYHYLAPGFYFGATDSATRLVSYKILRLLRERFWKHHMSVQHYYQDAHVLTSAVRQWLDEKPPEPFFLLVHYMDPHDPYFEIPYNGKAIARVVNPSPDPSQAPEMRRLYAQGVRYLDEHLGLLLRDFRDRGLMDRTWFVLTSDHGEEFYEHGGWWHGTTLYEEQVRVPLVIRGPAGKGPVGRRDDIALTVDIFPTMVRALGYSPPEGLRGIDLLQGGGVDERLVFAEEDLEGNRLSMIRIGTEKLIVANPGNPRGLAELELYDLETDPQELRNLALERPERVTELLAALETFRQRLMADRPGAFGN